MKKTLTVADALAKLAKMKGGLPLFIDKNHEDGRVYELHGIKRIRLDGGSDEDEEAFAFAAVLLSSEEAILPEEVTTPDPEKYLRCVACGWHGSEAACIWFKPVSGTTFPQCPSCGLTELPVSGDCPLVEDSDLSDAFEYLRQECEAAAFPTGSPCAGISDAEWVDFAMAFPQTAAWLVRFGVPVPGMSVPEAARVAFLGMAENIGLREAGKILAERIATQPTGLLAMPDASWSDFPPGGVHGATVNEVADAPRTVNEAFKRIGSVTGPVVIEVARKLADLLPLERDEWFRQEAAARLFLGALKALPLKEANRLFWLHLRKVDPSLAPTLEAERQKHPWRQVWSWLKVALASLFKPVAVDY